MYEMMISRKWGRWEWSVHDSGGNSIVVGREFSRPAARYKAARALFDLLLSTPFVVSKSQSAKSTARRPGSSRNA